MTAIADMIAAVRKDLHDEDATAYRWTDAHLTRHIERAVADLSRVSALQVKSTVATAEGSRSIDISSTCTNRLRIEAVEYPVDKYPTVYAPFFEWADTLTLLVDELPSGDDCYVYWTQAHSIGTTQSFPTTLNALVALGAAGYAAVELASYGTERVNVDPAAVERYQKWGESRLTEFRAELKKIGRKVRTRRLYT
ncbi:MAG: hypothetical protein EPO21_11790 [Chloroflexota bacterium]|nr:MAG: hypothetical protein EPO21_11790 [Chloroflexota bacterium]